MYVCCQGGSGQTGRTDRIKALGGGAGGWLEGHSLLKTANSLYKVVAKAARTELKVWGVGLVGGRGGVW